MPIFNSLPVAFPWYDKKQKLNVYKLNSVGKCDYKLLSPLDALLPFQFYRTAALEAPKTWEIREINSDNLQATIASLDKIRAKTLEGKDYFYYDGSVLQTSAGNLNLQAGNYYYSKIIFPSGYTAYSEMFYVDGSFSWITQYQSRYIRLEWYCKDDLKPIFYNDIDDTTGKPYFRNVTFLDTMVVASEPAITEETEKDGDDVDIPVFQKANILYRIEATVPDFLKTALVLSQLNESVNLNTNFGLENGEILKLITSSQLDADGYLSTVVLSFQQDLIIIQRGCPDYLVKDNYPGFTPTLTLAKETSGSLKLTGTAPVNSFIDLYGSTTESGVYAFLAGSLASNLFNAGTLSVNSSVYGSRTWFKVKARNLNTDYGFSNTLQKT